MKHLLETTLAVIKEEGVLLTAVILVMGWVFYLDYQDRKVDEAEKTALIQEITTMRGEIKDCYEREILLLIETIDRNTHALEDFQNKK